MPSGTDLARRIKVALLITGILVFGCILALFALNRQKVSPEQNDISPEEKIATISISGIHHTDTGERNWILDARTAVLRRDINRSYLTDLTATFFSESGDTVLLSAASGTLNMDSKDLEVSGDVVLKNEQYEMRTETLTYIHEKRMFITESTVDIQSPAFHETANGMTYYLDSERIDSNGNVEGGFEIDNR